MFDSWPKTLAFLLLGAAAVLSYGAVRALVRSAVRGPTMLALAAWLPVASVVVTAAIRGRWGLAVAVVFSAAVLAVTMLPGVTFVATAGSTSAVSRRLRLLLPVALAAVLTGFKGNITLIHSAVLLGLGCVCALAWRERNEETLPPAAKENFSGTTVGFIVIGAGLAALSGWYAIEGVKQFEAFAGAALDGPAAALMLAPASLLPMIGLASEAGRSGRSEDATAAAAGITLLNLCLLLPGLAVAWAAVRWTHAPRDASSLTPLRDAILAGDAALPFPVAKWRVDSILLALAAVLFFPAALGRLRIGKAEGVVLLVGYVLYVTTTASSALGG